MNEREYRQAYDRGEQSRRNSGRIGDCPYRGKTDRVLKLAEAWRNGWLAAFRAARARG